MFTLLIVHFTQFSSYRRRSLVDLQRMKSETGSVWGPTSKNRTDSRDSNCEGGGRTQQALFKKTTYGSIQNHKMSICHNLNTQNVK